MTGSTSIEWTDRTWNPVTGCTKVSPGCDRCYADAIAHRFAGTPAFPNGFTVTLRPERLDAPLRWRRPARVFVNSMSDLFHSEIPEHFIAEVFAVMAATPRHTYQVLTKRHGRMRSLLTSPAFHERVSVERGAIDDQPVPGGRVEWPLPNVWVGVSVEDQQRAELRIPALLATPAAVRFLSCEPLLGPVDLRRWIGCRHDLITVADTCAHCGVDTVEVARDDATAPATGVGWVIVGGESGPGARRADTRWVSEIVTHCRRGLVAVFVKQLGSAHGPHKGADMTSWPPALRVRDYPHTTSTTSPTRPTARPAAPSLDPSPVVAAGRPRTPTGGAA